MVVRILLLACFAATVLSSYYYKPMPEEEACVRYDGRPAEEFCLGQSDPNGGKGKGKGTGNSTSSCNPIATNVDFDTCACLCAVWETSTPGATGAPEKCRGFFWQPASNGPMDGKGSGRRLFQVNGDVPSSSSCFLYSSGTFFAGSESGGEGKGKGKGTGGRRLLESGPVTAVGGRPTAGCTSALAFYLLFFYFLFFLLFLFVSFV